MTPDPLAASPTAGHPITPSGHAGGGRLHPQHSSVEVDLLGQSGALGQQRRTQYSIMLAQLLRTVSEDSYHAGPVKGTAPVLSIPFHISISGSGAALVFLLADRKK